jgi:hypothetical protein
VHLKIPFNIFFITVLPFVDMTRILLIILILASFSYAKSQFLTPFEKSEGLESATYFDAIALFDSFSRISPYVHLQSVGTTDAGYPLHLVLISSDGQFDPTQWHLQKKVVILVNNSIHPGEPDGTDASLLLVRDIAIGKIKPDPKVCMAIIPVYNIGGALNRGSYSRVNQNGPQEYGFRGNAQYLDLNRDFTKSDSRNAATFAQIFHYLDPEILIDNHVSDGADFQYTMTLLTTQYDKLGQVLGEWLRSEFEPAIYKGMKQKSWDLFPYVNFNAYDLSKGMTQFYDPPRFSSGYAALFQTIGFVPETHMLKPYKERVKSTYDLMVTIANVASSKAESLIATRKKQREAVLSDKQFPLSFEPDTEKSTILTFKGYQRDTTISEVTGLPRMFYRRDLPFDAPVRFFNYFKPMQFVEKPKAYIIPQGWHRVHELLRLNGIDLQPLNKDTSMSVEVYRIKNYTASSRPYEGHFRLNKVETEKSMETVKLLKGDYIAYTQQPGNRFLVEMLEPDGPDSYFSWNYFDAILQQKEGYSNYRWEEVAADWLKKNPGLRAALEAKKIAEPDFAKNSSRILQWVYQNSPYFEPGYMRYPIYRIM